MSLLTDAIWLEILLISAMRSCVTRDTRAHTHASHATRNTHLLGLCLLLRLAYRLHRLVVVLLQEGVEPHRILLKHALAALQSVLALQ